MAWYLCTISRHEPRNWERCKEAGLWGVPGESKAAREVKKGDQLLFWMGGRGYIGFGQVTDLGRVPLRRDEVPWAGGLARWSYIIPMRVQVEIKQPVRLKFSHSVQELTGFAATHFQRGFASIADKPAQTVAEQILERSFEEVEEGHTL